MPVLAGPPPLVTTLTFSDLIEKTLRYLVSSQRDMAVQLTAGCEAGTDTLIVGGVAAPSIAIGAILSVDLEIFYVLGVNNDTVMVVPGYQGSEPASHAAGTLCFIDPEFTKFDIAVAINDDLDDLSSPENSLYGIDSAAITYNPTYMGYDLGALPENFIDVLEVRYQIPTPTHNFPLIGGNKWQVARQINNNAIWPSGRGLITYESAYPGLPMYVTYAYPFVHMVDLTDPVVATTGLPSTAVDIPPMGAAIRLGDGREVKRNFIESQPDARKAPEVPPGAVGGSFKWLEARHSKRIDAEADRIRRQYPRLRSY